MDIIGVIPARAKSSRFPGKPLADIWGRPMVARVYDQVAKVSAFREVVIATEDEAIKDKCSELEIPCVMTRDDHKTGTDRVAEVAKMIDADIYVNIQGDEPLLEPDTIELAAQPFMEGVSNFEVTNLMTPIQKMSDLMDSTVPKVVVNDNSDAVFLSRLPIPYPKGGQDQMIYYKQVCVYGFTPSALEQFSRLSQGPSESAEGIELLRFIEHDIKVRMLITDQDTVAVDTPNDLETVRELLRSRYNS